MYVAEFENHCDISRWSPNSAIVQAVSTSGPEGPYTRVGVAVKPFAHNPKVVRAPDGTWLMYTIGVPRTAIFNCSSSGAEGVTVDNGVPPVKPDPSRPGRNPSNLESNITLYTSKSIEGPWVSAGVVLGADYFDSWDEVLMYYAIKINSIIRF